MIQHSDEPVEIKAPVEEVRHIMPIFRIEKSDKSKYEIGVKIPCKWSDGNFYMAEILSSKDHDGEHEYYVHYLDFDKRLDRWVNASSFEFTLDQVQSKNGENDGEEHKTTTSVCDTPKQEDIAMPEKRMTRLNSRKLDAVFPHNHEVNEKCQDSNEHEKKHQEVTKIRNIEVIFFGAFEIHTWYYSPFPEEYGQQKTLYICEYCLKYMRKKKTISRHNDKCLLTTPPGRIIYRDNNVKELNGPTRKDDPTYADSISVFEVDGAVEKLYCQNICLISKLFLDHKTLYFDVSPFKFYVLTQDNRTGSHVAGYFSKEKSPTNDHNLACIMVLPPYQRRGYGKFLISYSYYMSKLENRICTPERPLSDMGKVSYKSYWADTLLEVLHQYKGNLSIKELSELTYIKTDDIVSTLSSLNLVRYWKGQYVLSLVNTKIIEEHFKKKQERLKASETKPLIFKPELVLTLNT